MAERVGSDIGYHILACRSVMRVCVHILKSEIKKM